MEKNNAVTYFKTKISYKHRLNKLKELENIKKACKYVYKSRHHY